MYYRSTYGARQRYYGGSSWRSNRNYVAARKPGTSHRSVRRFTGYKPRSSRYSGYNSSFFILKTAEGQTGPNNNGEASGRDEHQFGGFIGADAYRNVFDQYKINYVETSMWITMENKGQMTQTHSPYKTPRVASSIDTDSGPNPSQIVDAWGRANSRQELLTPGKIHKFGYKPCAASTLQTPSAASNNAAVVKSPWCDMSRTDVMHFGALWGIDVPQWSAQPQDNPDVQIHYTTKAWVEMRGVRNGAL